MEKIKVNFDGEQVEVSPSDIEADGHAILDKQDYNSLRQKAVEAELLKYSTGNFASDFYKAVPGGKSTIMALEGERFKADPAGRVYLADQNGEFLTDDKGRISIERFYGNNPGLKHALEKGINSYYKERS